MNFQGFMGVPMNEQIFADMQKGNPWFQAGGLFRRQKPLDLSKKKDGEELTSVETAQLIFAKIFGSFGFKQDLNGAEDICIHALAELEKVKPVKNKRRDDNAWMTWQNQYGQTQIQLGTVYAYKQETIKAAYHFMLGLKSEMVEMNMPYCDFIRYIVSKLADLPKAKAEYAGRGFTATKPMGCTPAVRVALDAQIAMSVIPEMEGENGEVVIARKGGMVFYGHLERCGSVSGGIDVYETWLIDKDYNLKAVQFYFNGYRSLSAFKQPITLAKGFGIKPHTALHEAFEFIDELPTGLCRICGAKIDESKEVCGDCSKKKDVRILTPLV
jgi:hypothetical protein